MMQPPSMDYRPVARELILHHFELSPFAEKVRLMLGCKAAQWHSVLIPMLMPKPDVLALTGGYRRTPLLQIGADVWCDSALIARVLDRELGGPTLFPATQPLAPVLAQWADWTLFWSVIDFASQPACLAHRFGHLTEAQRLAIAADRNPFRASVPKLTLNDAGACLQQHTCRRWSANSPAAMNLCAVSCRWPTSAWPMCCGTCAGQSRWLNNCWHPSSR